MNPTLSEYCRLQLEEIEAAGLLRGLRSWEVAGTRLVRCEGREFLNFSSNDYLGLATHPRLREALAGATGVGATGAGASRLITGNHDGYALLEEALARFKRTEAALVFSSGYATALGIIPALMGRGDYIVMDKLCHACLVDGARLSGATIRVFPHNQIRRCGELLAGCRALAGEAGRILLMTESVFSMDGDLAPLDALVELKKRHGAWLLVDEAHGTGVLGRNGRGGAEHFGVEGEIDVSMATLSKAVGVVGGFVCGSRLLREFLINRARTLIFSTGIPESVCRVAAASIRIMGEEPELRARLGERMKLLGENLGAVVSSPIVPVPIGDERKCLAVAEALRAEGLMVPAVRYPTVGRGKARLRVSLSAAHTSEDVSRLAEALRRHPLI